MVNLSNPREVKKFAEQEGIPVEAVYKMEIQHKSQLIEQTPNNSRLYSERGQAYHAIHNYDLAIQDFLKVIELTPDKVYGYYYLGETYIALGENKEAIEYFTKALEFKDYKNILSVYKRLSDVYFYMHDYSKSLEVLNEAIQIDSPDLPELHRYRCRIYQALGDKDNAYKDFYYWKPSTLNYLKKKELSKMSRYEKEDMLAFMFSKMTEEELDDILAQVIFNNTADIQKIVSSLGY